MVRVAAVLFCVVIGLGAGYALWGTPLSGLEEALDRVSTENDQLRTRFVEASHQPNQEFSASLSAILHKLSEQSESLHVQQQTQQQVIADLSTAKPDEQAEEALRAYEAAQTKMQQQLETCLFAKAAAERAVAAAKKASAPPRPGTQTVTETIELPKLPPGVQFDKPTKP
jgi:hypothetical protein